MILRFSYKPVAKLFLRKVSSEVQLMDPQVSHCDCSGTNDQDVAHVEETTGVVDDLNEN
jgi:hypothetical protein